MPQLLLLWVLSLESQGLLVSVQVNDVTVYSKDGGILSSYSEKINPLLFSGDNEVRIQLGLPSPPSPKKRSRAPNQSPQNSQEAPVFTLTLQKGEQGKDPGQEGSLLRFEWDSKLMPLTPGEMKTVFEGKFQVQPLPFPPPPWSQIPPIQVDRPALETFVREYASALRKRDVQTLTTLNAPKSQELSRSLGLDPARMTQGFQGFLESLMSAKNWSVSVAPTLEFKLEGKARLVRITSARGSAPITATSEANTIPFDITVSFIGGAWRLVR
ncbi:MAG TPA: hypothetical protein VKP61_03495 [Candidatus Acidoferrum sp.]|nr:hypothetical protein [Candidatus Acidoferrum sp.]